MECRRIDQNQPMLVEVLPTLIITPHRGAAPLKHQVLERPGLYRIGEF